MMVNCTGAITNKRDYEVTENDYKLSKELYSKVASKRYSGDNNPNYGSGTNYHTEASSDKWRASMAKKSQEELNRIYSALNEGYYKNIDKIKVIQSEKSKSWWASLSKEDYTNFCRNRKRGDHGKHVKNIETGEEFKSISKAAAKYRCARASIKNSCETGKLAAGYHWEYVN